MIKNVARKIKRSLFYKGHSKNVYSFLKEIEKTKSPWSFKLKNERNRSIYINLSFDLELALNGNFWRNNFNGALANARQALLNIKNVCSLLNTPGIEYNIQICAGLLDEALCDLPFLNKKQSYFIRSNQRFFSLDKSIIEKMKQPDVEIGVHSLSHRDFSGLSKKEAVWEIEKSVELCKKYFNNSPTFMAFPNNTAKYENLLADYSLSYRINDNLNPPSKTSIPRGLYWHPLSLSQRGLKETLKILEAQKNPAFLHLWQHFTETNVKETSEYLKIIRAFNCIIINTKNFFSLLNN